MHNNSGSYTKASSVIGSQVIGTQDKLVFLNNPISDNLRPKC